MALFSGKRLGVLERPRRFTGSLRGSWIGVRSLARRQRVFATSDDRESREGWTQAYKESDLRHDPDQPSHARKLLSA